MTQRDMVERRGKGKEWKGSRKELLDRIGLE